MAPAVSYVVPARNEADGLPRTLDSIAAQTADVAREVVVVDGDSEDGTAAVARGHGARVVRQSRGGIGRGRDLGARAADGDWLAFVDADTVLSPRQLETMLAFVEREDLAAASSWCHIAGPRRASVMQAVINRVFPRLERPVLPGFHLVVDAEAYRGVGGFPDVPNEDTAFSRRLARTEPTGYCPAVLAETSGRRIERAGLTGTLWHYLRLDARRLLATQR
jgi:glycosyltransferase involved in cell wall biosynthesis